tara:strand:+ start:226 stop:729 length:504 start_codon:yes stop_codon:yes gene_type:complete
MRKIFLLIFLSLIISSSAHTDIIKVGNPLLSEKIIAHFIDYTKGNIGYGNHKGLNKPVSFWVTEDGLDSYFWYTQVTVPMPRDIKMEKYYCEKTFKKKCIQIAKNRTLKFLNTNNQVQKIIFSSRQTYEEINEIFRNSNLSVIYINDVVTLNSSMYNSAYIDWRNDE